MVTLGPFSTLLWLPQFLITRCHGYGSPLSPISITHPLPWLQWSSITRCHGYRGPYFHVAMVTPSLTHHHGCHGYSITHPSPWLPWLLWCLPPIHLLPMVTVTPPITRCHGYRGPNKPVAMVTIVTQHPLPWLPFSPNIRCHGYRGHLPPVTRCSGSPMCCHGYHGSRGSLCACCHGYPITHLLPWLPWLLCPPPLLPMVTIPHHPLPWLLCSAHAPRRGSSITHPFPWQP